MFLLLYPTPGIMPRATTKKADDNDTSKDKKVNGASNKDDKKPVPGTLPASASDLSNAARGLLLRLLDRDPRARLRSLRQLQQTAFFMGFDFGLVKEMKISPKDVLQHYFPDDPHMKPTAETQNAESFDAFSQVLCLT